MLSCVQAKAIRADFSDEPLSAYVKRYRFPMYVSEKRDGYGVFIEKDGSQVSIVDRGTFQYRDGFLATGVAEAIEADQALALGELIADDGKQGDLYKIRNYMANGKQDKLRIVLYDLLELDRQDLRSTGFLGRLNRLKEIVKPNAYVQVLKQEVCMDEHHILKTRDEALAEGYEGVVVKGMDSPYANGAMLRLKNRETADVAILGITKTQGFKETSVAHSLLIGFYDKETGTFKRFGKVGAWDNEPVESWATLTRYLMATSVGQDRNFILVRPTVVAEIAYEAKLEDSFRSPRILRIREDKTVEECVGKQVKR